MTPHGVNHRMHLTPVRSPQERLARGLAIPGRRGAMGAGGPHLDAPRGLNGLPLGKMENFPTCDRHRINADAGEAEVSGLSALKVHFQFVLIDARFKKGDNWLGKEAPPVFRLQNIKVSS